MFLHATIGFRSCHFTCQLGLVLHRYMGVKTSYIVEYLGLVRQNIRSNGDMFYMFWGGYVKFYPCMTMAKSSASMFQMKF